MQRDIKQREMQNSRVDYAVNEDLDVQKPGVGLHDAALVTSTVPRFTVSLQGTSGTTTEIQLRKKIESKLNWTSKLFSRSCSY